MRECQLHPLLSPIRFSRPLCVTPFTSLLFSLFWKPKEHSPTARIRKFYSLMHPSEKSTPTCDLFLWESVTLSSPWAQEFPSKLPIWVINLTWWNMCPARAHATLPAFWCHWNAQLRSRLKGTKIPLAQVPSLRLDTASLTVLDKRSLTNKNAAYSVKRRLKKSLGCFWLRVILSRSTHISLRLSVEWQNKSFASETIAGTEVRFLISYFISLSYL